MTILSIQTIQHNCNMFFKCIYIIYNVPCIYMRTTAIMFYSWPIIFTIYVCVLVSIFWLKKETSCWETNFSKSNRHPCPSPWVVLNSVIFSEFPWHALKSNCVFVLIVRQIYYYWLNGKEICFSYTAVTLNCQLVFIQTSSCINNTNTCKGFCAGNDYLKT